MILPQHKTTAMFGLIAFAFFFSRVNADDDVRDPNPAPAAASADDRPLEHQPRRDGRGPARRDDGHPAAGPPRGAGDLRRDDRWRGFAPSGRGPAESAGPQRWPLGDTDWLKANDPEMYKLIETDSNLERQTRELSLEYRRTPADKQVAVKQRLQDLVLEQFDARQQRRALELKRLEDELQRIRESIEKRSGAKQSIVDRRVSELVGDQPQF
jgi:hypothetical protein